MAFCGALKDGSVYVFYNKERNRVKYLLWDRNGFVLYQKRLERGRFKLSLGKNQGCNMISQAQLDWLLAGLDFDLMAQLYALEKQLREQKASPEFIYKTRHEKATPILQAIKEVIEKNITKILPKSPLGKAVFYLLGNWKALNNYSLLTSVATYWRMNVEYQS